MGIIDTIPSAWHLFVKENPYCNPSILDQKCFQLSILGKMVELTDITSKMAYKEMVSQKQTPPTAKAKISRSHPDLSTKWKRLYSLAFEITLDTKLREFQYK